MKRIFQIIPIILLFIGCQNKDSISIDNGIVKLEFDLKAGTYKGIDLKTGQICIYNAVWRINDNLSSEADNISYSITDIQDSLGTGKTIRLQSNKEGQPSMVFDFSLYDEKTYVIMQGGIKNNTSSDAIIKELSPIANAKLFQGLDISENFRVIDGEGGGATTYIRRTPSLTTQNNMIIHFGTDDNMHSIIGGGVSYSEFAKYASIGTGGNEREKYLKSNKIENLSFISYFDLGEKEIKKDDGNPSIELSPVNNYTFEYSQAYKEAQTIVWADKEIKISLHNLSEDKPYTIGIVWCDDANTRKQSIGLKYGEKEITYIDNMQLPSLSKKEEPQIIYVQIPQEANSTNPQLIISGKENNVVLSELIIYEGELKENMLNNPQTVLPYTIDFKECMYNLYASDPVGKLVDKGGEYYAVADRFYIDFVSPNPIYSSEKYAQTLQKIQNIKLNYYYFPTICLWYAMEPRYGGDIVMGTNDSPGAVEEMKRVRNSGFLKYTTMGIRLVPDCYEENNENGWWDDEHWQMHGSGNQHEGMKLKGAHYRAPYETSKKWAQAIHELGGLPFTYFQTAVRSKDYAEKYPEHMLFNESFHEVESFDWLNKNYSSYDFTDKSFVKHMKEVYQNLHDAGIIGMMFDYPYTGWPIYGGMDDKYSTAASAYRTIFKLAHEGLGENSYIHERNLTYGSDIALGYVSSQRTWGDTDVITAEMVARSGLRWYKNRVVVNYDMDAKNLLKAQPNDSDDGINKLLTMSYVTASRLLLANSFGTLNAKHIYKLSRIYPFHQFAKSARPLDAFTSDYPRVYGMKLTDNWTSLTFYNEDENEEKRISIKLAGIEGRGGIGLNENAEYHIYDFWNDQYIGKIKGNSTLSQELRKGEARQMAIHKVENNPQVLSTDRHILQGFLELSNINWNNNTKNLSGNAQLIEDEALNIVIETNGYKVQDCSVTDKKTECKVIKISDSIYKLYLKNKKGGNINWEITFSK